MIRFFALFCLLSVCSATTVRTETQEPMEYALKAEFICNFTKFVRWPVENGSENPLMICILGENHFESVLSRLGDKKVRGRPIRFASCGDTEQCISRIREKPERCHVLFISPSEKNRFALILSELGALPILTVGDTPGFAALGGIINLIQIGDQLRFEINTETATRSGLTISSQLLKRVQPVLSKIQIKYFNNINQLSVTFLSLK